jgi:transcriptional regulator
VYVPAPFAVDDEAAAELLRHHGAADLVTATDAGLMATFLPFVFDPDVGDRGALLGHVARANPHWRHGSLGEALAIVHGPDAYISPSWYASKSQHGRVVPTWNHVTVHVHGELLVHDDAEWLDAQVRRLTDRHEAQLPQPWSVDDAPAAFIAGQLRGIVGVELRISRIEAKAKLSQNRSEADVAGVVTGLTNRGDTVSADAVRDGAHRVP